LSAANKVMAVMNADTGKVITTVLLNLDLVPVLEQFGFWNRFLEFKPIPLCEVLIRRSLTYTPSVF
jgi:hypothetical protein